MRIFVAGATGAVGRPLLRQLVGAGHHVTAITRSPDKVAALRQLGADPLVCDVFDRDRLVRAVVDVGPEAIINQLTELPQEMNPRALAAVYSRNDRVRRDGTNNLLDAARASGARRFIAQSAGFWYRPNGYELRSESDPLWADAPEPIGTAVRTIVEMEAAVRSRAVIGVLLRYGGFYGPGTWLARDGMVGKMAAAGKYPIIGRGDAVSSFIHVDDAAAAAVAALEAQSPGVYNVADDDPAPAHVWIPEYVKALGGKPPRRVPVFLARLLLGKPFTAFVTSMRGISNAKIKNDLRWQPKYRSWREGMVDG